MARLPCDVHGSVPRGRMLGLYPALVKNNDRYSKYRRVCIDCMAHVLHAHRKDWTPGQLTFDSDNTPVCTSCGTVYETESELCRFYVTAYVKPDQRVDYTAMYCSDCSDMVIAEFQLERINGRA